MKPNWPVVSGVYDTGNQTTAASTFGVAHAYCWSRDYLGAGNFAQDIDQLNFESHEDLRQQKVQQGFNASLLLRCIKCPVCIKCDGSGVAISIEAGFSVASGSDEGGAVEDNLHVYRCPHASPCNSQSGGCAAATLDEIKHGQQCVNNHAGLLCSSCANGFRLDGSGGCIPCGELEVDSIMLVALIALVVLLACCKLSIYARILRKLWPRLRQSVNIAIGNIQVSRITTGLILTYFAFHVMILYHFA
eukprot:COSAG02_NODE_2575_length_8498_cov_9.569473_2_plen_247_part_00